MTNLTLSEKRTIFRILNLIMRADFIIKPTEIEFLDKVFKRFELDLSEFDHMEDLEIEELFDIYSSFSSETKEYAKKLFIEMAECDGFVDPREMTIINKLI